MRTFIAVDIEDPQILDKLMELEKRIVDTGADVKLVERENLHITLRFLGEIPIPLVQQVQKILSKLSFRKFRARLRGLGAFPTPSLPRVIWVGVAEGSEELKRIYEWIESELRKLGFRPEREEFIPHVTLARVRSPRGRSELVRLLQELRDVEVGEIIVDKVRLKKSTLTPRGPIYTTLFEVCAQES